MYLATKYNLITVNDFMGAAGPAVVVDLESTYHMLKYELWQQQSVAVGGPPKRSLKFGSCSKWLGLHQIVCRETGTVSGEKTGGLGI